VEIMKTKHIVALVGILALLALATAAAAGTANLTVKIVDSHGVTVGGTVIAQVGTDASTKKTCTASAGTCTLTGLTTGKTYTVIARTAAGKTGSVNKLFTGAVTITVQAK
jgi:hypothetical protein